jgi:hypothetical protein
MSGWWRIDEDDGRFVREAPDAWVYGPADPRLEGIRVPGARDVTLGDAVPPDLERAKSLVGYVFFRESVVAREPDLAWLGASGSTAPDSHPAVAGYLGVPVDEWEPREGEVVGMRAPELADGFERDVAVAEREVRAWRRVRTLAARHRDGLVGHARHTLGASGSELARSIGVSRTRIQQICDERGDGTIGSPSSIGDATRAVQAAHKDFAHADEMLRRAEAIRKLRVAAACDDGGLSLAAVGRILDVSRPRAQQLRDAGRADAAAA